MPNLGVAVPEDDGYDSVAATTLRASPNARAIISS